MQPSCEQRADMISLNIIKKAGYEPYEAARLLEKLGRTASEQGKKTESAELMERAALIKNKTKE